MIIMNRTCESFARAIHPRAAVGRDRPESDSNRIRARPITVTETELDIVYQLSATFLCLCVLPPVSGSDTQRCCDRYESLETFANIWILYFVKLKTRLKCLKFGRLQTRA